MVVQSCPLVADLGAFLPLRRFIEIFRRADELNEDPLHGFLVGLRMLAETLADLPNGDAGCLVASYCYQNRLLDCDVRELNMAAVLGWRRRFRERIERIAAASPPRLKMNPRDA